MANAIGEPQQGYQPPEGYVLTKKKRKKWPWVLGIIAFLVIIIAVSANGSDGGASTPSSPSTPADTADTAATSGIAYEVTAEGGGTAMVTYTSDENMNIAQENGVALPWTKTVDLGDGIFSGGASLSAQGDVSTTSITCRVVQDGKVVSENTSTGQFAVVTCSNF